MRKEKQTDAQESIQKAYIHLIQSVPIQKIKVTELCRKAAVNRSTFYSYYTDVYELQSIMVNTLLDLLIKETMATLHSNFIGHEKSTQDIVEAALYATISHREFCKVLLTGHGSSAFEQKLLDSLLQYSGLRYRKFINHNEDDFKLKYTLFVGGIVVLWKRWIIEDYRIPVPYMTSVISNFIHKNAQDLWK